MKKEIINLSKKENIDLIGFTKFLNLEFSKISYLKEKGFLTPFNKEYDTKEYEGFNTAIVIGCSYYNELIEKTNTLEKNTVYFSSSSWGRDYHKFLKEKLGVISDYLEEKNYKTKICVDNNSLNERYLAQQAGLGYIGLNGCLINDEYGSYIFLGVLLTDALIQEDKPLNKTCLMCMSCVIECPTNAIKENGEINGNECLSYLTQKKELNQKEITYLNNCIYGCDICQKVCPLNSNLKTNTSFVPYGIEFINLKTYKTLSNKEFDKIYGNLSGAWRGKKIIERNINEYRKTLEKTNEE